MKQWVYVCDKLPIGMIFFFVYAGTGEGEVADAEKLLNPFRLRYPRVGLSLIFVNRLFKFVRNLL